MSERALQRLQDMKRAIGDVNQLLGGHDSSIINDNRVVRAAFERFLEIISEASRGVPEEWKNSVAPDLPWKRIADIGNVIRHAYDRLDAETLWNVYEKHLGNLEVAVDRILADRISGG